jgi:hypothetical protein
MPLPQPPPPPPPQPAFPQHEPDGPDNYPTEYNGFQPVQDAGLAEEFENEYEYEDEDVRSVEHDRPIGAGDDDDYLDDDDEDREPERLSPIKEWLLIAGQLAIGVVGGAGLWLGFNWLWVKIPVAAVFAAVAVIVGMVWVVRKARRAEDLLTTIITVFIGLVVTVTPAAVLLLSR